MGRQDGWLEARSLGIEKGLQMGELLLSRSMFLWVEFDSILSSFQANSLLYCFRDQIRKSNL